MNGESDSVVPKPQLQFIHGMEPQWQCDHCGKEFTTKKEWRLRLAGKLDNPDIFDRCLDLCAPCALIVAEKIKQVTKLLAEEGNHVASATTAIDQERIEYEGALGSEGETNQNESAGV